MKIYAAAALVLFALTGCHSKPEPEQLSAWGRELQGSHLLRQITTVTSTSSHLSGGYFLIGGSISADTTTETRVTFAWKGNDDIYRFTTLPLSKVLIKLNEHIGTPFVKFQWNSYNGINYAVICANPKDWPEDLAIPATKDVKETK